MKIFSFYKETDCFWIRIGTFGYGLHFNRSPMLFSERNGYTKTKYLKLPLKWRVSLLKPCNRKMDE